MSIFDDIKNKSQVASANQVPVVTTLNAAAPVVSAVPKKDDLVQLVKQQAAALENSNALIAQLTARLNQSATQLPMASAAPAEELTHFHHYQGGKNKQGREYPEGWVITAKKIPVGQKFVRGMSADDVLQIRLSFPEGHEKEFFQTVIDPAVKSDKVMATSNLYKRMIAEKNMVYVK